MSEHRVDTEGTGEPLEDTRNPLRDLRTNDDFRYRLELLEDEVKKVFNAERREPQILYDTAEHLLQAGGKHLRSLLIMLGAEAVGGDLEKILPFAVAAEYVQTASLIHDDVIDEDETRRGVESTHLKFGTKMAVIAGDLLVGIAVKLIGEKTEPDLLTLIASAGIQMCEGEAADLLLFESTPQVLTKEEYFNVIQRKSVSFIKSSVKVGAIVAKADKNQEEILEEYGEQLGYAFQIRDDILDATVPIDDSEQLPLSDIKGNRCNFVLVHALESSSDSNKQRCLQGLENGDIKPALTLIRRTGAIEHAINLSRDFTNRAKRIIQGKGFLNEQLLCLLADFAVDRDH